MSQAFNLSQLANKVNSSGKLDGTTGLTGTVTSSSSAVILGSTSGSVTITAPAVAGTTTLTLPAQTGTVMVNGPAFSAYANAGQILTSGVPTKVLYGVEEFDTNSNFASSRFTPTVAGYYQINAQIQPNDVYTGNWIAIYKNGSLFKYGNFYLGSATGGSVVSSLVSLNGSTDYVEIYALFVFGQAMASGPQFSYFQASMVRSA